MFGLIHLCASSLMGVPAAVAINLWILVIALAGPLALLIEKKNVK
jgi:hypothetical protein